MEGGEFWASAHIDAEVLSEGPHLDTLDGVLEVVLETGEL
jgi:hypothetical protein